MNLEYNYILLDATSDIFVSHHNFVIASHLILLLSKFKHSVFSKNLSLADIEHFSDDPQASFLISRRHYFAFKNTNYLDLKSELLYIPSASLLSLDPVIVNKSSLPFTNIEILELLSAHHSTC